MNRKILTLVFLTRDSAKHANRWLSMLFQFGNTEKILYYLVFWQNNLISIKNIIENTFLTEYLHDFLHDGLFLIGAVKE